MDLLPYVAQLHRELAVAAEAGGEESRALAERLTAPLESATRLVLLEALSAAAGEITRELAPGSVDVRLRGSEPDFVVMLPFHDSVAAAAEESPAPAGPRVGPPPSGPAEEGGTARISLRLPEHVKARVEEAAGRAGLSVNGWLVQAVSAALDGDGRGARTDRHTGPLGRRYTGWVR